MKLLAILLLSGIAVLSAADKVETLQFKPAPNMTRAEILFVKIVQHPKAVLVLCPGHNGNGRNLILAHEWQAFAKKHGLDLWSISFASDPALIDLGKGYPFAADGSGEILLDAIRIRYGEDLPLLLYGFSSGALFTEHFADWKPQRTLAWAAHATGWCGPQQYNSAPGLISCGDTDESRYGGAIVYFKEGRAQGKRLLWLSLPGLAHATSGEQENFVRRFFAAALNGKPESGQWVDVDRKSGISEREATRIPALAGWLPDGTLLSNWSKIHSP